ncbi:hypothetical protein B0O80DRAFT_444171 [Mortierella sp. GBAus27b]|nr:hypothetical protein B0O80DRAFT_444171 [Mortierella sp. GBAus27b]
MAPCLWHCLCPSLLVVVCAHASRQVSKANMHTHPALQPCTTLPSFLARIVLPPPGTYPRSCPLQGPLHHVHTRPAPHPRFVLRPKLDTRANLLCILLQ